MGELGDLLELLHDAHAAVDTFVVAYSERAYRRASREVVVVDAGDEPLELTWRGGGPWAEDIIRTRRIWLQRPDRLRVELLDGEALIRLGVRAGARWWRWDETQGVSSGSLAAGEAQIARLPPLLRAPLFAVHGLSARMRLEPTGAGERAGRHVICANGRPRRPAPARGELAYELEFDAEHGSLLRYAEVEDGAYAWERTAIEVIYGLELDPGCFEFVVPE